MKNIEQRINEVVESQLNEQSKMQQLLYRQYPRVVE